MRERIIIMALPLIRVTRMRNYVVSVRTSAGTVVGKDRKCEVMRRKPPIIRAEFERNYDTGIKPGEVKSNPPAEGKPNPSTNSDSQPKPNPGREALTRECSEYGKRFEDGQGVYNVNFPYAVFCSPQCSGKSRKDKVVSPNSNHEKGENNQPSEVKVNPSAQTENSTEKSQPVNPPNSEMPQAEKNSTSELDTKTLLQYFQKNSISRISLTSEGNLQIEYSNQSANKIITNGQALESQEQQILNFLQKSNQKSLDQQKIRKMINAPQSNSPPVDYFPYLVFGGVALITILVVGVINRIGSRIES
ncbi:hypothetical protein C1645_735615 [Glomus cerebriforme]|uniref:Uncharacterized protein n=1 Tax=Glomus cerebriforme TaxID=658196 RepID=A0A397TEL9_9GLOM|nr:hypothetical protein C1645_735615 [Glomus cerebriforme]